MSEHAPNSTNSTDIANCPVCLEDKHMSYFFKFRCSHSICKTCYRNLRNKEKCFYCRADIMDKEAYEMFQKILIRYLLWISIDLFCIAFNLMTLTLDKRSLTIVFYIEMAYSSILPFLLIKRGFNVPPSSYNIILLCLKINWFIFLIISKITWWKALILSVSKLISIYTTVSFEMCRIDTGVIYFNDVASEIDVVTEPSSREEV